MQNTFRGTGHPLRSVILGFGFLQNLRVAPLAICGFEINSPPPSTSAGEICCDWLLPDSTIATDKSIAANVAQ